MPGHYFLEKADSALVCTCDCERARITFPPQMDCPWCGCGWLFACAECGGTFAFARGTWLNETWEETGQRELGRRWGNEPSDDEVAAWVGAMKELLAVVEMGKHYVYFDGFVVPTDVDGLAYEGWHSRHDLDCVPHVAALKDPSVKDDVLTNRSYWLDRKVQRN